MNTNCYMRAEQDIQYIREATKKADKYVLKLLFANIITVFESYLCCSLIEMLQFDTKYLKNLTHSELYKNHKMLLSKILENNMEVYITEMVKKLVFHKLSDIQPLYKSVVNIDFEIKDEMLDAINTRHDIIHRNGWTKSGTEVVIKISDIETTITIFYDTINKIEKSLKELKCQPTSA